MLPTTFDEYGRASARQHSCCLILEDKIALDAGSLAMAVSDCQRNSIRNVVLTHAHLDHIAGLPFFIDDLFATLQEPVKIHAVSEVIESLKTHVFNWDIFPKFDELENEFGKVMTYEVLNCSDEFLIKNLRFKAIRVNHKVPSVGYLISNAEKKIAVTGDTAATEEIWEILNGEEKIDALFIECAFPDELTNLAEISYHLTPKYLEKELQKFKHAESQIFAINLKPMYHDQIVAELQKTDIKNFQIMEVGKTYII